MRIKLLLLLFLTCCNISYTTEEPKKSNEKIPLGINIDWATDWNNMEMFTDIIKQARGFGSVNEPWKNVGLIKLDEKGWPIEDFGIVVFTARKHLTDKIYNISFNTNTLINLKLIATNGKLYDVKFDKKSNLMTGKIYLPKVADQLMISFKNTDKGVRNIKIINELNDEKEIFIKEFLEMHKGFGVFRFMELQAMNKTNIRDWSNQATCDDIFQNRNGLAWEYAIDICNNLNGDIWINIPHKATDDYIMKLAQLLKSNLNNDLKVYVEYSNEPWNLAFPQNEYLKEIGISNGIQSKNEYFVAGLQAADRLKTISDLFVRVFGNDSINARIRPVLGAQIVWPDIIESQLQYIKKNYGNPNKYFYGFAGGAYVSGKSTSVSTLDEVYSLVKTNIENSTKELKYRENMALAKKYKLKFIAYEGGIDIIGQNFSAVGEISKQFIQDKRMAELMNLHLNTWYKETDNSLFMWYKSGTSETWGLTNTMDDIETEKMKTMKEIQERLKYSNGGKK